MMRRENWPILLSEAIDEARNRGFAWSVFDCATFAFDVRARLTGIDASQQWRGRYRSLTGGLRVMRRLGHHDLAALATAECGQPLPAAVAMRGDLVLLGGGIGALGVCLGADVATVAEGAGLVIVPIQTATISWRV